MEESALEKKRLSVRTGKVLLKAKKVPRKNKVKKNILIIHPGPGTSRILGVHLSGLGHRIVWAKTLKKAQGLIKKKKIHLVISSLDKKIRPELNTMMAQKMKAKWVLIHQKKPRKGGLPLAHEEFWEPFNLPWFVERMQRLLARQRHF